MLRTQYNMHDAHHLCVRSISYAQIELCISAQFYLCICILVISRLSLFLLYLVLTAAVAAETAPTGDNFLCFALPSGQTGGGPPEAPRSDFFYYLGLCPRPQDFLRHIPPLMYSTGDESRLLPFVISAFPPICQPGRSWLRPALPPSGRPGVWRRPAPDPRPISGY